MPVAASFAPYCGPAPDPGELWTRWNLDPAVLGAMAAAALAYVAWRRRCPGPDLPVAAAFVLLLILFVSPLCALSSALFSARVAHHTVLIAIAAPLIVYAAPIQGLRRPLPLSLATGVHAVMIWLWHAPGPYAWALDSHAAYWLMQACLFGSALVFWAAVRSASGIAAAAALLATMVQMGLLGALITFAGAPLYAPHLLTTWPWGLTPLQDQQLAGLIMWAPAAGLYLLAALFVLARALGADARPPVPAR